MTTHTNSDRTVEMGDEPANYMRWPMQSTQFEDRRRYATTMTSFGWFAVLAALAAIVMGASLAFAI
jgi:hypothetical protein